MDNLASQWLGYEFHAASLVGNSMKQSKCELNLLEPISLYVVIHADWIGGAAVEAEGLFFRLLKM